MKTPLCIIIFMLLLLNTNAQITFTKDTWEPIGNTALKLRFDDEDNGDGLNDGAITVDGKDTLGPLGILYTFQGSMQSGVTYNIETITYKIQSSYVKYFVELYNATDNSILTSSNLIVHGTYDTPADFVITNLNYTASSLDEGDILQLRFVRENTEASNHTARDFAIDNAKLNSDFLPNFSQIFIPKPKLDLPAITPSTVELNEMDAIFEGMSTIILGNTPPTSNKLNLAIAEYNNLNLVPNETRIKGIVFDDSDINEWSRASFIKTFAQHLKHNPNDITVYTNGLTIKEMAINATWFFAQEFFLTNLTLDYINYFFKIYSEGAVYIYPLLNELQKNQFYYALYRHSENMVFYWSPNYTYGLTSVGAINIDDIYNVSHIQLVFGLQQSTNTERLQWTKASKRYFERFFTYSPGTSDGIKTDGSTFHHFSALNNYTYCYSTPMKILPVLQGTTFQLSQDAYKVMRDATYTQLLVSNDNVEPLSMSGRHPEARQTTINKALLRNMAITGGKILGLPGPDPYLSGAYVRLWGTHTDLTITQPETLSGFTQMNYHTGGLFWKNNWMVSARGQTNWGFGAEIFNTNNYNTYGRYQSYGALEVIYAGGQVTGNGYKYDGWNWNYNPGTTSINLPWNLLRAETTSTQQEYQENNFTGSLAFKNNNQPILSKIKGDYGIFSMDFKESLINSSYRTEPEQMNTHDASFKFKKSVFFFNDYILSLGSNIENTDTTNNTVTTLFQRSSETQTNVIVNNANHSNFETNIFNSATDHWIIDNFNTGYYVVSGSDNVILKRENQQVPYHRQYDYTLAETNPSADNTIGYLDHGTAPNNAQYEFVILPDTNLASMNTFANSMITKPYEIIQKDKNAHIVHEKNKNIVGYSLFTVNENLGSNGFLIDSNSEPCLVMYQQIDENTIKLAISNPDLGFTKRSFVPSAIVPIKIDLTNKWNISTPHNHVNLVGNNSNTSLEFTTLDGLPIEISLERETSLSAQNQTDTIVNNIVVYPNPSKDSFTLLNVKNLDLKQLKIFDITGRLIKTSKLNYSNTKSLINISKLKTGNYYIVIYSKNIKIVKRLIKE